MTAKERRIVTILFSDIIGSTGIAEQLDPEDWREIVEQVHKAAGDIIVAYHGRVLQYLGDGILAVFGAELGSERDPERAIRAALEILAAISVLPTEPNVEMRAGVHTGLVVLGDLGGEAKQELTATGDAMNLAQRLQSLADPSRVIISQACYRYVRGLFNVTKLAPCTVRGRRALVEPYLVMGLKDRPFRMITRGVGGVQTTTVGREEETARLNRQLDKVLHGDALIWSQIIGGPGLGKTRLMADVIEVLDQVEGQICVMRTQALEGDTMRPYAAIRRLWFDQFELAEDTPAGEVEQTWEKSLTRLIGQDHSNGTLALGLLLGLSFEGHPAIGLLRGEPASISPLALRASQRLLAHVRQGNPLILLLEDLQWADHGTWDYLMQVFLKSGERRDGSERTLILATARPEWLPPAGLLEHKAYQPLKLNPLTSADSTVLLSQLLQHCEALPEDLLGRLIQLSEGVPYYLEEMVNWLIDTRVLDIHMQPWRFKPENLDEKLLPQTLHHLLSTRINNLRPELRAILQSGAVFGSHFWQDGLSALGSSSEVNDLERLAHRGFLQRADSSSFTGEQEWSFHQKLMQVVAYESVLKRDRPQQHREAARWLEQRARDAGRLPAFAGHLGQHYEKAGDVTQALTWYLEHDEAQSQLGRADQRGSQLEHMLTLAKEIHEGRMIAQVHYHNGAYQHSLGKYADSLKSMDLALAAMNEGDDPELEGLVLGIAATDQSRLGDFDTARHTAETALGIVDRIENESTIARMLTNISLVYTDHGDTGRAAELFERQIEINQRTGETYGEALGYSNYGYHLIQLGMFQEGLEALERAATLCQEIKALRIQAYVALNLGLAYFRVGSPEKGRAIIDEQACEEFEATGDRFGIGSAGCYLGLCHEAKGDFVTAREAFHDAHRTLVEIGVPGQAMDALAGLARCHLELGDIEQASQMNEEVWAFLRKEEAEGLEFPLLAYQTCVRVFEATEKKVQAEQAKKEGYDELMRRAERISDDRWRESYLEKIPEHRVLF